MACLAKQAELYRLMKKLKGDTLFSLEVYFPTGTPYIFPPPTAPQCTQACLPLPSGHGWMDAFWLHRGVHYTGELVFYRMYNRRRSSRLHVQVDLFHLSVGHISFCENHCLCSIDVPATLVQFQFFPDLAPSCPRAFAHAIHFFCKSPPSTLISPGCFLCTLPASV